MITTTMLWLSLRLPTLLLDQLSRGVDTSEAVSLPPLAIVISTAKGQRLHQCNEVARQLGLQPGLSLSAALSSAPELRYFPYDANAEQATLEQLAAWVYQYTSVVSLDPPDALLLEIGGSLRLFGGIGSLGQQLRADLTEQGYHTQITIAPFPALASLLTSAGQERLITDPLRIPWVLHKIPITALPLSPQQQYDLTALGLYHVSDVIAQPRDSLARRFGFELLRYLDQLLGQQADPRPPYTPPLTFQSRLELLDAVEVSDQLLFACNRLLQELSAIVQARVLAVEQLEFQLQHDRAWRVQDKRSNASSTSLTLNFAQPSADLQHWLNVLRMRLEALVLGAPVSAVALNIKRLVPFETQSHDLFDNRQHTATEAAVLLDRLLARLGPESVRGLTTMADHRPEYAWRWFLPEHLAHKDTKRSGAITLTTPSKRPLWLLRQPLVLETGPPSDWHLQGPERIESGWWDGDDVSRDYYYAQTPQGKRVWLFRERRGQRRWFIQGVFG